MLTVFVAEDQLLIQKDLCIKLIKARSDIEIVGTALNGQEAYEKIKTLKPDILFTDIKMPVETGLSLIKRLKEENNPVRTVILSGYREFEYARQSLKLGVDEYLLKPVSIEDLSYTLDSLWEKIKTEREKELLSALTGLVNNASSFSPDVIQDNINCNYYYALLVHTGSLPMIPLTDIYLQKSSSTSLSKDELSRKYLKDGETLYIIQSFQKEDIFLLLCLNDLRNNKIELICREITHSLQTLGEPVTICVSEEMTILRDLGINSNFMRTQLASQLTFGFSSVLYQKDFILTEESPELLDNTKKSGLFSEKNIGLFY